MRRAGGAEGVERGGVRGVGQFDADRPVDLAGVAPDLAAALVEDATLGGVGVGAQDAVPELGVLRGQAQRHLLAAAADQDRDRVAHWRGHVGPPVRQDRFQAVPEGAQAVGGRTELVAELAVVALGPAGADAEDQPPARHVVDRLRHVGEEGGVAVAVAGDEGAELHPFGHLGHPGQQAPALEVRPLGVAGEREEVVPGPEGVDAERLDAAPGLAHRGVGGVLGPDLDPDADRLRGHAPLLV